VIVIVRLIRAERIARSRGHKPARNDELLEEVI